MKKIYSLLLVLCALLPLSAKALTVNVEVNLADAATYMDMATYSNVTFQQGMNVVTFDDNSYMKMLIINALDGHEIVSVEDKDGGEVPFNYFSSTYASINAANLGDHTLVLTMAKLVESSVTIRVDRDDVLGCSYGYEYLPLNKGDNTVTFMGSTTLNIGTSSSQYYIDSVTNVTTGQEIQTGPKMLYLEVGSANDGQVFSITTGDLNEERPDSPCAMDVWLEDASLVNLNWYGSDIRIEDAVNGWNVLRYIDGIELALQISSNNSRPLFKVLADGEPVEETWGYYQVDCANGKKIEIFTTLPDVDLPVTVSFTNEGTENAISEFSINDEFIDNWIEGLTVKYGDNIYIAFNNNDYRINSITLNGQIQSNNYALNINAVEPIAIEIDATAYPTYTFTIDIDDPDNAIVYRGNQWSGDPFILVPGQNTVTVAQNNNSVDVIKQMGCYIESVTLNGTEIAEGWSGYNVYDIKEGDVLVIRTGRIVLDKKACVWTLGWDSAYYAYFQNSSNESYTLHDGYNIIEFGDSYNPFTMGAYSTADDFFCRLYVNDELCDPRYPGTNSFQFSLTDNSIVKILFDTEAVFCDVQLTSSIEGATATADYLREIADLNGTIRVMEGTRIAVTAPGEKTLVKVDGESIAADENGEYVITVEGNCTIAISENSGVESVTVATEAEGAIYNLQGMRLTTDFDALPAGIYIVGGKKVIK